MSMYLFSAFAALERLQVAQLWQRDCAKLASFSVNVQLYSINHKIAFFEPPYGGIMGNISALSESFNAKKLCSRIRENVSFIRKTAK